MRQGPARANHVTRAVQFKTLVDDIFTRHRLFHTSRYSCEKQDEEEEKDDDEDYSNYNHNLGGWLDNLRTLFRGEQLERPIPSDAIAAVWMAEGFAAMRAEHGKLPALGVIGYCTSRSRWLSNLKT
ncbi:hypothetical protein PG995_007651 [Apiospora arundinis]